MIAIVDIIVAAFLAMMTYIGMRRGLVSEILGLLFLVVALAAPLLFADDITNIIDSPAAGDPESLFHKTLYIAVFAAMFIGVWFVGKVVRAVARKLQGEQFQGLSAIGGGLFGFIRGGVLSVVLLALARWAFPDAETWGQDSYFMPVFEATTDFVETWLISGRELTR